jgi:hypothetical protein
VSRSDGAQAAVRAAMWPEPAKPRTFRNTTQFIIGRLAGGPDGVS